MAWSRHEGCSGGLRNAEALRRSADAVLSRKHADQPRGERRRAMLRARGTRTDSKSAPLLKEDCQGIRERFGTVGKVSEVYGNGQTKRPCREFPWLWQNSLSSQGLRITVLPASFRLSVPSESLAIFARNAGVPICREVSWGRSSLLPRSLAFLASADCK